MTVRLSQGRDDPNAKDGLLTYYTLAQSQTAHPVLSGLTPLDPSRGVRVVKDVLRLGRWKAGQSDWNVTDEVLKTLANEFSAMVAAGVRSSFYWGSRPDGGPLGQHGVEAKNAIAPIDQVFVQDGVLYASAYVTDEQAKQLANPSHQVSVGVQPDWTDGAFNKYSLALLHVAIVDHPVVTGQGPFLTLSLDSTKEDEDMNPELKATLDALTLSNKTLAESFISLSNKFDALQAETAAKKADAAKDAWNAKLKSQFDAKRIDAGTLKTYQELGETVGYNLALLAPLDKLTMLANESNVLTLANGKEPSVGPDAQPSADDIAEALKQLAG